MYLDSDEKIWFQLFSPAKEYKTLNYMYIEKEEKNDKREYDIFKISK